jgi:hypothetical protein
MHGRNKPVIQPGPGPLSTSQQKRTIRLQALVLINNRNKYKSDLTTDGVVIADVFKYVTEKQKQINSLQNLDERIETTEIEKTMDGVQ